MKELSTIQKEFFETLQYIQEQAIFNTLNNYNSDIKIEDLLCNVTFEVIVEILLMIDGYNDNMIKVDLIDLNSKKSIKDNIELHDECVKYLRV